MLCKMAETLRIAEIEKALAGLGWTQRRLAEELGVTAQAITNWLKGKDFPRPSALLGLSRALGLTFENLVDRGRPEPIVAFRRKAATKTTLEIIDRAKSLGDLLRPLVPFLDSLDDDQLVFRSTSQDYDHIQKLAASRRSAFGVSQNAVLDYGRLISSFRENGAVIVPVIWEEKARPNALHIRLPDENVTFIYLNLAAKIADFKFWMAHELAHIFTPSLCGLEEGEDFADAFAAAILFPREIAEEASKRCSGNSMPACLGVLTEYAVQHEVSLFTVYSQTNAFRHRFGMKPLPVDEKTIHIARNSGQGETVRGRLWDGVVPSPELYLAAARDVFRSPFFEALRQLLLSGMGGVGYVQQALDISRADATAIHAVLTR